MSRLVIIGGVAGGATAAARARRLSESSRIIMFEKNADVSVATCGLPYFIGGEIPDRSRLVMSTPQYLRDTLAIDVRTQHEATAINREKKEITVVNLSVPAGSPGSIFSVPYDKLLIATGASPVIPPIRGLKEAMQKNRVFTLRTLHDTDRIMQAVANAERGSSVVIVGGGPIGLEMVEALAHCGLKLTVVEALPTVFSILDPELTRPILNELELRDVTVLTSKKVVAFRYPNEKNIEVELDCGTFLPANFVIQSIGVAPESTLAKAAGLQLNGRGAIAVNQFLQSVSDPDIYAVGDVACTPFCTYPKAQWLPLGGPANRMARIAADHMVGGDDGTDPYRGSLGSSIVRAFDIVAGRTGMNERDCVNANIVYGVNTISGPSHASYYPGSTPITVKVVYEQPSGRLLGGQVVGSHEGVDKRIDVLATAIAGNMTVDDLGHLDLAYAPPYSSARDVINTAGFAGANSRRGMLNQCSQLTANGPSDQPLVIDVREETMASIAPVPPASVGGADPQNIINIPLDQLRDNIEEISSIIGHGHARRKVICVCSEGKMSYFACRILNHNGIQALSLANGLRSLPKVTPVPRNVSSPRMFAPISSANAPSPSLVTKGVDSGQIEIVDACGVACPGPIMMIQKKLSSLKAGEMLCVKASDPGFLNDFPAFCTAHSLNLHSMLKAEGIITAFCSRQGPLEGGPTGQTYEEPGGQAINHDHDVAIVVFSGELDKVLAAFVIANGAIAMGGSATLFFTFWGLNAVRRTNDAPPHADDISHPSQNIMDHILSFMQPHGAEQLPLSHFDIGGLGRVLMKSRMKQKHLPSLPDLMKSAFEGGVRLVACTMSMEALGFSTDDLLEGVQFGGVADFLLSASQARSTLFI